MTKSVEAGADGFKLVEQAVAHEFGHAREARLFAEYGVFPWHCVTYGNCFFNTEVGRLAANRFLPGFAHLTNVMQDFAIDRKLSEYGIKDHTARARIFEMQQTLQERITDATGRVQRRLQALFHLPSDIRNYIYSDISEEEKELIVKFVTSVVGANEWKKANTLVTSREYGDLPGYERLTVSYFRDFLHMEATFEPVRREALGDLAAFWTSPTYKALHIR